MLTVLMTGMTGVGEHGAGVIFEASGQPLHTLLVAGGWTALNLVRQGQRVVLVDAWGPGNSRSSSGGDTRIIRHGYGDNRLYQDMAARSLVIWQAFARRWNRSLYQATGVLWMIQDDDSFEQATLPHLVDAGIEHEVWDVDEVARRYPQINTEGIRWARWQCEPSKRVRALAVA